MISVAILSSTRIEIARYPHLWYHRGIPYLYLAEPRDSLGALMEVLLTYKESNIEVKIQEGEDSLSKLRQALLIALNYHPGCSVADNSAATDRCRFQR